MVYLGAPINGGYIKLTHTKAVCLDAVMAIRKIFSSKLN